MSLDEIEIFNPDEVKTFTEIPIGKEGMKVDQKLFEKAREEFIKDKDVRYAFDSNQRDVAEELVRDRYEDKPELYMTLDKIRQSERVDRRITWWEVLERAYGRISRFKSREEKLEDECKKFISIYNPKSEDVPGIKNFLKAYVGDEEFRNLVNSGGNLHHSPEFSFEEYKALGKWRDILPQYAKDYISFNIYVD